MTAAQALELGLVPGASAREELVAELKENPGAPVHAQHAGDRADAAQPARAKHEVFQRFIDESFTDYLNILTDLEDFGIAAWVRPAAADMEKPLNSMCSVRSGP